MTIDIFRTSGLMRPKWDRKQAGSTYETCHPDGT